MVAVGTLAAFFWAISALAPGLSAADGYAGRLGHLVTNASRWPGDEPHGLGKYAWVLSQTALQNGITYKGAANRLRLALDRMARGQRVVIGTVGGSITAQGHWLRLFQHYLKHQYGYDNVEVRNGGVSATDSSYAAACHRAHVSNDSDIIVVELAYNDKMLGTPPMIYSAAEKLLRTLLSYPKRPAVVYLNTVGWKDTGYQNWWHSMEGIYNELTSYYSVPSVSLRACCFHLLAEGRARGFSNVPAKLNPNKDHSFFSDTCHPGRLTGSRVLSEILAYLFDTVLKDLRSSPVRAADKVAWRAPLPPSLLPHSTEDMNSRCFVGEDFRDRVVRSEGFFWVNDAGLNKLPKWGMVTDMVGAEMDVLVDTQRADAGRASQLVVLELMFLASFEDVGCAKVTCASGCKCMPSVYDGYFGAPFSFFKMHKMLVTQSAKCIIRIQVSDATRTGKHKVKVSGVAVTRRSAGELDHTARRGRAAARRTGTELEHAADVALQAHILTRDPMAS